MKDRITNSETESAINWSEIHRRMETALASIERGIALSPEERSSILKTRAIKLAQKLHEEKETVDSVELLEILLANESYGVETLFVREVFTLRELRPLPCTPAFVIGITNFRGEIISVIDIKKFFGLPETLRNDHSKVIVVRDEEIEFGILADDVSSVRSISHSVIQPSLYGITGAGAEYIKGVTSDRTVILNMEKLLSDKKVVVFEDV